MNFKSLRSLAFIFSLLIFSFHANCRSMVDPDPTRYQSEIDQYQEWDQKNSPPERAILFVGSSSIRLWLTRQAFPEFPVMNRGFGGAHISDVLYYYQQLLAPYDPSVIVFYCGDNDIADGKTAEQVFEDYLELVKRILDNKPLVKFIYLPIKPSPSRFSHWTEMNRLNAMIKDFNDKNPRLFYVDVATVLLNTKAEPDSAFFISDLLHLNEKGYESWNKILVPQLRKIYFEQK